MPYGRDIASGLHADEVLGQVSGLLWSGVAQEEIYILIHPQLLSITWIAVEVTKSDRTINGHCGGRFSARSSTACITYTGEIALL